MIAIITNTIVDADLLVDGAKTGATFNLDSARSLAVVTTASSASTPGGTTIQLSVSMDGVNWVALGSAVSVSANASYAITAADCVTACSYKYGRIGYARASGSYVANTRVLIKGDA